MLAFNGAKQQKVASRHDQLSRYTMTKTLREPIKGTPITTVSNDELDPRRVRESAGLEPAEMAKLMGMGEYGYTAWERGIRKPGGPAFQLLKVIADAPEHVVPLLQESSSAN